MKLRDKACVVILVAAIGIVAVYVGISKEVRAATWQRGMPVRCRVWINNALVNQNVPMTCNTPDGGEYTNVPEGLFLYITDIIVKRRLGSQTRVAASVRIWEESGGGSTGCGGDSVIGSFVTDQYITLADATIDGQAHLAYNTPYLVATPNDCLAVYTSTPAGLIVELSGYQWTSLGVPASQGFLPAISE